MTHEELNGLIFYTTDDGQTRCLDKGKPLFELEEPAFLTSPKYANLLSAAPLMYQQLTIQRDTLQLLINVFETLPNPGPQITKLLSILVNAQSDIMMIQQTAHVGINAASAALDENRPK